jgi:uncharacterized protein (TIGR03067 family)
MSFHLGLIAVVLLSAADEKPKDAESIQGAWDAVEVVVEGKAQAAGETKKMSVVFKNELMSVLIDGKEEERYTFKLDSTKNPKNIDVSEKDGKEPAEGIYELDGDSLKLCWNSANKVKGRPENFTPTPENKLSMMLLKRKGK